MTVTGERVAGKAVTEKAVMKMTVEEERVAGKAVMKMTVEEESVTGKAVTGKTMTEKTVREKTLAGKVLLGKYELRRRIGEGGNGVVYLAWDRHMERFVAVKEEKRAGKPEGADMLKREMEMLKTLKHPMLPAVYDYFGEDKQYLVMEYITGESLHNLIEKEGSIDEEQALSWALQLLELFSYLHTRKPPVIYRDLKPENIIVCPDKKLRLVDFGAALSIRYDKQNQDGLAGTMGYAAPEQLGGRIGYAAPEQLGGRIGYAAPEQLGGRMGYAAPEQFGGMDGFRGRADERSDIYTLGATLYHMLTGHHPALPPYGIRPIRCMKPELTPGMEQIVKRCTEPVSANRYQTVEEVRKALQRKKYLGRGCFMGKIGKKERYVMRRLEKKIWLTEKKTVGLLGLGILLFGLALGSFSIPAKGREAPLPVIVYNGQGQKLVIRYDSVYKLEGNLLLELEQELFDAESIQQLSISLTDGRTGESQERIFYIQGMGEGDGK